MRTDVSVCFREASKETPGAAAYALSPAQKCVYEGLLSAAESCAILLLKGDSGRGKTSILRALHAAWGGVVLSAGDFLALLRARRPEAIEETFLELVEGALAIHETVFIDDFNLILSVVQGYEYPRQGLFETVIATMVDAVERQGKRLVLSIGDHNPPQQIADRGYMCEIESLEPEDYRAIAGHYLRDGVQHVDCERVHRFAPELSACQIKNASLWLARNGAQTTDALIEHLEKRNLTSNVDLEEVAVVNWKDLKGVDDVIRELEAKIALPLENHQLAKDLKLKAKRGVLLAGPPGTGKTTIGRALAHRLKGKFFLIDGTAVAGSDRFYGTVNRIFDAAAKNAPAVIFIDDADVIFQNGESGFYRYLLTKMDGLESASTERVCVMLTAMEAGALPPAILRSGRVELWLETRLPDEAARTAILREHLAALPEPLCSTDVAGIAQATRGLTGADLKALVEDAKLTYAQQVTERAVPEALSEHFRRAIAAFRHKAVAYGKKRSAGFVGKAIGFGV